MATDRIPFMQFRGGSSKGVLFSAADLPEQEAERNEVILSAMGGDDRQIDGLGGGHPLTSKVGIISPSNRDDCDVDYLFAQVVVGENRVDTSPNCGNILAAVGPYAIESGMTSVSGDKTRIRVYMKNTGSRCELEVETPGGRVNYQGDATVDGVPGTAAPIVCNYLDIAGASCGALLPTGNTIDQVDGVEATCIDNGMPVVLLRATDFDITGYESAEELNHNEALKQRIESIRLQLGEAMNLGDVTHRVVPKMSLIAPPRKGGVLSTRTFIPHTCHTAIGVLGAVSVATACVAEGTVSTGIAELDTETPTRLRIEHPTGSFDITLILDKQGDVVKAGLVRTARLLCRGELYV